MKVLITGSTGQLGKALIALHPKFLNDQVIQLITCNRSDFDLSDQDSCKSLIAYYRPDWLINTAAYTAVDKAESERELAHLVNADAPNILSSELANIGGKMLQISTDFVFSGMQGFPYSTDQLVEPLSVYGMTKAAGEKAVMLNLKRNAHILRTSWLYAPEGKNFMLTMLALHNARDQINVVSDQIGCPTSVFSLAKACWRVVELQSASKNSDFPQILHWSDSGVASWYDFAEAIGEIGLQLGLIKKKAAVNPITTKQFSSIATRPSYSILDCMGTRQQLDIYPDHWRVSLLDVLRRAYGT